MLNEFKKFITKGNVIDLAVAVVIGAAFGAITSSLVKDIITPPLGLITGGVDFSNLGVILGSTEYASVTEAVAAGAPVIQYGVFLNAVINFLLVAGAMFFVVKGVAKAQAMTEKEEAEAEAAAPPAPAPDVVLLEEIRDLLKAQQS